MPFQLVNDSRTDSSAGTQTSPTCSSVGMPAITSRMLRSRGEKLRDPLRRRRRRRERLPAGTAGGVATLMAS